MSTRFIPRSAYGLTSVAGGARPDFFFHADQIPGSDGSAVPASFPCIGRHLLNASQTSMPTILAASASWNNKRALSFATGQLDLDALGALWTDVGQDMCWVFALYSSSWTVSGVRTFVSATSTTDANVGAYTYASSSQVSLYLDPSTTTATSQSSGSMSAWAGVPCVMGLCRGSGNWSYKVLGSGGETSYKADTAFAKTGGLSNLRLSIGAEPGAGVPTGYGSTFRGIMRAGAVWVSQGSWNATKLTNLLTHFRDHLDCAP